MEIPRIPPMTSDDTAHTPDDSDDASDGRPELQRTIAHRERMAGLRAAMRAELERLLAGRTSLTWEVGCGHGHFLTGYADAFPESFCLGVDLIEDRIDRGMRKRNRAELDNLHFIRGEATMFLEQLPAWVSIESVFILFPDPWPKKRHHKNRIMQAPFLADLAKRCKPGAALHFRTDYAPYFADTLEIMRAHPDWQVREDLPWPFELETVFQSRADGYQSMIAVRR